MLKEIIAIVTTFFIIGFAIYLFLKRKIDNKTLTTFLIFSIFLGLAITNYNDIFKVSAYGLAIETAKKEINGVKKDALNEINKEMNTQKESISLLISSENLTRDQMQKQNEKLNDILDRATQLQDKIIELNSSAEKTKKDIEKLNIASRQIALILVRATYLTLETRNEFGTARVEKAVQEINNDLNNILPMVIPDNNERAVWVENLKNVLSKKKEE